MTDLMRRVLHAHQTVATELIARGAFKSADLRHLAKALRAKSRYAEKVRRDMVDGKRLAVLQAVAAHLAGEPWERDPGFIPALAFADRQMAIHAVINGNLADEELRQFEKLINLQTDGHLLKQLRSAVEIEIERRKKHGRRSSRNIVTGI